MFFNSRYRNGESVLSKNTLLLLEEKIGYHFNDISLLQQAITHSSYTNEQKINKIGNYERFEFLGDAILELVTSEFLFHQYPNMQEGKLTKTRASIVCESSLVFCAKNLELGDFIVLGKGETSTGGRYRDSIIADVVEAVIGAIYLDSDIQNAKAFIDKFILSDIEEKQLFYDSKTNLQELSQGKLKKEIQYKLLEEMGPEHNKIFKVCVLMDGEQIGQGLGRTKKAAEQQAAYEALLSLRDKL